MIKINPFALAARIKRPLILDGAVGSLLQWRLGIYDSPLWSSDFNTTHPDEVLKLHKEYVAAGADIITTNTFRTNPAAYQQSKQKRLFKKNLIEAVNLAKEAVRGTPVLIAGSNAPAEDCYQTARKLTQKELKENHRKHITALMEAGCSFILNETQSHVDEIKIISEFCSKEDIPYVMSVFITEDEKLLSGEPLSEAIRLIENYNPLATGVNCIFPKTFRKLVNKEIFHYNWGYYLNCGSSNLTGRVIKCDLSPGKYAEIVLSSLKYNPSFIGGCCGSSPSHIKTIRRLFNEKSNNKITGKN
ncbi:MAG: homocysteine S-methyltransferase family protein [Ignavibacteriaceae bacterium]